MYAYGDGFQYFRPWLIEDENEVTKIVAVHDDCILVTFGDNSLAVLSLPELNVMDLKERTWLGPQVGDIVAMHVDEPGEKGYVYVGTSEGLLLVMECLTPSGTLRLCDYSINCSDAGLGSRMAISAIHMCPKDEKYLAIAYDGATPDEGSIVIFDLVKHKPHRVYETAGITSIAWVHNGEHLYAGIDVPEGL